jgi:DNA-binding transcriptional regulator YhcF (GntR family)
MVRASRRLTNHDLARHIAVHPAAELFPMMPEPELRELAEDIKKNGVRFPVTLWRGGWNGDTYLLDGRNRLDAMELAGNRLNWRGGYAKAFDDFGFHTVGGDPYEYVITANLHRRHLTSEQKRELVEKVLKAKPETSDRVIAKQTKVDHKTVGKARTKLESTGEIPQTEKTFGADGKARAKKKKASAKKKLTKLDSVATPRVAETQVISAERRRAEMAALDSGEVSADEGRAHNAATESATSADRIVTDMFDGLPSPPPDADTLIRRLLESADQNNVTERQLVEAFSRRLKGNLIALTWNFATPKDRQEFARAFFRDVGHERRRGRRSARPKRGKERKAASSSALEVKDVDQGGNQMHFPFNEAARSAAA